jgi:hypothetical protein
MTLWTTVANSISVNSSRSPWNHNTMFYAKETDSISTGPLRSRSVRIGGEEVP